MPTATEADAASRCVIERNPERSSFQLRNRFKRSRCAGPFQLLYTGQRRADVVRFGRQHVKEGALQFVQQKNERRAHKAMRIPILPQLQEALDLVPATQLTFLVTGFGKPFTAAGFGNWMRDKCDQAGLKGYSAHGLRKALQTMGAELGLSDRELMAIAATRRPR